MDNVKMDRNLVGVLFPGIVKNDEKALECLGGIRNISQVYSHPTKKRLGLSYQPDNPYVMKIHATTKKAAGVLLKVKIKKTKIGNEVKKEVVSTSVLGRVSKMYIFESMCDFQYLPIHQDSSGQPECLLDKILPSGTDSFNFMLDPSPHFILPSNFTRFDKPVNYSYTDKRYPERKEVASDEEDDLHHKRRSDRSIPLARCNFNLTDELPTEPYKQHIDHKNEKMGIIPDLAEDYETVKELFEERPIYSYNVIKYETKIKVSVLKVILPCLAFYMKNGPWRLLWIRFGYDPRKEPGSRMYQILDFRLRQTGGVRSMVMTRDQIVHYKKADRVRHHKRRAEDPLLMPEEVPEGAVYFRPGMVPSQRQIFYQYCDVQLPEVQEILAADPPPGYLCHQKRGWLPPNTDDVCRDHIFRYVKQTLLASHSAELKFEQAGSSEEGSNSDDDDLNTIATEVDEALNT